MFFLPRVQVYNAYCYIVQEFDASSYFGCIYRNIAMNNNLFFVFYVFDHSLMHAKYIYNLYVHEYNKEVLCPSNSLFV